MTASSTLISPRSPESSSLIIRFLRRCSGMSQSIPSQPPWPMMRERSIRIRPSSLCHPSASGSRSLVVVSPVPIPSTMSRLALPTSNSSSSLSVTLTLTARNSTFLTPSSASTSTSSWLTPLIILATFQRWSSSLSIQSQMLLLILVTRHPTRWSLMWPCLCLSRCACLSFRTSWLWWMCTGHPESLGT